MNEPSASESLKLYFRDSAPDGYEAWLDRNLAEDDPVVRAWRRKDSLPLRYRNSRSYKCWHDRCLHYIYGFSNQEERDQHAKEHSILLKRDSGLSIAATPPLIFQDQSAHHRDDSNDYSKRSSPLYLPRPSGSLQLTHPPVPGLSREYKDSLKSYSLATDPSAPAKDLRRGSVDSEVDPLLPPLKRSRVGPSRLESIGELRLLRESDACLRCRVLHQEVSTGMLYRY